MQEAKDEADSAQSRHEEQLVALKLKLNKKNQVPCRTIHEGCARVQVGLEGCFIFDWLSAYRK